MQRHVGRYLRNADNVGWNFCLVGSMGQRLLSAQKHSSSTHYRNPFSTDLAAIVIGRSLFHNSLYIQPDTDLITLASFSFLFAPLPYPRKLQGISGSVYRRRAGEFQNHKVHRGDNVAKSPSDKRSITVQFVVTLNLHIRSDVWGSGQY
jgi:hypothetical protein